MDSFNQNGEPQELVTGSRDGITTTHMDDNRKLISPSLFG